MEKLFAVPVRLNKEEIGAFCFGSCKKAVIAGLYDAFLGGMQACNEEDCPHEEKRMDYGVAGENDEHHVWLRRLRKDGDVLCQVKGD